MADENVKPNQIVGKEDVDEVFARFSLNKDNKDDAEQRDGEVQQVMEVLESIFSNPEFTDSIRKFVEENSPDFVYVEEGQEQPLSNYNLYLKYTKLIEDQLDGFLKDNGISQEDIANVCMSEKSGEGKSWYCLEYIVASSEYESFINLMNDFRSMLEFSFDGEELLGYSCLGNLEPLEALEPDDRNGVNAEGSTSCN